MKLLIPSHRLPQNVDQLRIKVYERLSKKYVMHIFPYVFQNLPWIKHKPTENYVHVPCCRGHHRVSLSCIVFVVYHWLTLMGNFRSTQWNAPVRQGSYGNQDFLVRIPVLFWPNPIWSPSWLLLKESNFFN